MLAEETAEVLNEDSLAAALVFLEKVHRVLHQWSMVYIITVHNLLGQDHMVPVRCKIIFLVVAMPAFRALFALYGGLIDHSLVLT
jgi:hypothetical protein